MVTNRFLRLFHTVRYLKPIQLFGRFWFRVNRPSADLRPAPDLRPKKVWTIPVDKPISLVRPWEFSFLNLRHQCRFPADWNNNTLEKLWLYNLHYFDDLQGKDAGTRQEWHVELIEKWIDENPPGTGNGWEPYPLSLRIVNWIKWVLAGNEHSDSGVHSLAVQARYLCQRLEYHLLGNHLFANGKALLFAGLFFEGVEADRWFKKGFDILSKQIPEQVLPDGGHFERSPMYHSIILEDLLDCINMMRACGEDVPSAWKDATGRMLSWLTGMMHPDGEIVLFNDAAFGIAPRPEELFAYAGRLGLSVDQVPVGLKHFDTTGYIRVQRGEAVAFLDTAPIGPDYLPGHAHADTLTFELSLFGQRIVVDSGTSCYGVGKERLRQRGTAAHNTVSIDGENSSEVWSGFRVARRAKPFGLEVSSDGKSATLSCCHDGYHRLSGHPTHCRKWQFNERNILITDTISGKYSEAIGRIHFHPDVAVRMNDEGGSGSLAVTPGQEVQWKVEGGSVRLVPSSYHPEFGVSLPGQCMEISFTGDECSLEIWW